MLMSETALLDPKLDSIFKRQFVENTDILIDLINAVRSEEPPVVALEVKNPDILPVELEGKHIILDIWAQDETGKQYDIEMQTTKHAGWSARSVYYLARALGEQLQSGQGYHEIKPVIGIHLLGFDLFPEPGQAIWDFALRDRQRPGTVLDSTLQVNVIELSKADRLLLPTISPILAQWITYFQHWNEESVMQQIQHPPVQKAYQHLHALSGDELARREAFVRERALRDEITEKSVATAEGVLMGLSTLLRRQLRAKFGELPPAIEQKLSAAESSQLEHWGDRILSAQTLEQVFNHH